MSMFKFQWRDVFKISFELQSEAKGLKNKLIHLIQHSWSWLLNFHSLNRNLAKNKLKSLQYAAFDGLDQLDKL